MRGHSHPCGPCQYAFSVTDHRKVIDEQDSHECRRYPAVTRYMMLPVSLKEIAITNFPVAIAQCGEYEYDAS